MSESALPLPPALPLSTLTHSRGESFKREGEREGEGEGEREREFYVSRCLLLLTDRTPGREENMKESYIRKGSRG